MRSNANSSKRSYRSRVSDRRPLRAHSRLPMSRIAAAIDAGDNAFLLKLPRNRSVKKPRDIVAKLQGKVTKFMLIRDPLAREIPPMPDYAQEAVAVLLATRVPKIRSRRYGSPRSRSRSKNQRRRDLTIRSLSPFAHSRPVTVLRLRAFGAQRSRRTALQEDQKKTNVPKHPPAF